MHSNTHRVVPRPRTGRLAQAVLLAGLAFTPAAFAAGPFAHLTPVSAQALDRQRGGFMVNGLEIRFGIEMETYINGVRQATARIHDLPQSNLLQVGSGNTLSAGAFRQASGVLNVIQNSLDAQVIQQLTILNMQVHPTAAYRGGMQLSPLLQSRFPAS